MTKQLTISDLFNTITGHDINANKILCLPEKELFDWRRRLKKQLLDTQKNTSKKAVLVCAQCHQAVYLIGNTSQDMYFRHGVESGDCPIKTGSLYSHDEINRMKYNGVKESARHKELKLSIAGALELTQHCENIKMEKTIRASGLSKEYRRPDVSAQFKHQSLVFEIQISTTYLDVVIARETFYESERTFIMWVFDGFTKDGKRFTEKDVYYANKCNAFVITDESRALSNKTDMLHLVCHYKIAYSKKDTIRYEWCNKMITLDDLTFDTDNYKIYYHDFDKQLTLLKNTQEYFTLREEFEAFWFEHTTLPLAEKYRLFRDWDHLFFNLDLIDDNPDYDGVFLDEIKQILNALYSLKYRKILGYAYSSNPWIQLSNVIVTSHIEYAGMYHHALKAYGLIDEIRLADKHAAYSTKINKIRSGINQGDERYQQNTRYRHLFKALFPELFNKDHSKTP